MFFPFLCAYNLFRVPLLLLARAAGLFHSKIRRTFRGRRGRLQELQRKLQDIPPNARRIWIHASSMGEFEQSVPLLEALARRFPDDWFVLSLFSPSAYEHMRWSHPRTVITYLPLDGLRQSAAFIDMVRPSIHIIIRHDIWPNIQWLLKKKGIPSLLVNAGIADQRLEAVRRWRFFFRMIYNTFSAVCVVSELNRERFGLIYDRPGCLFVCGDTRYDRVRQRALETQKIETLIQSRQFDRSSCLVAGSTWPSDEEIILPALIERLKRRAEFKLVLAPHEIHAEHLRALEERLQHEGIEIVRLSSFEKNPSRPCRVLLIDRIGLLANLYALGSTAVVGGTFGPGVHSVLEPAAHGCAVCYGPRHRNSPEALEMTAAGIGRTFASVDEFSALLSELFDRPEMALRFGEQARAYVESRLGAADRSAEIVSGFIQHNKRHEGEQHG